MTCIVNNPTCMNGWEHNPETNKFKGKCECTYIKNARRRYRQANGDATLMAFYDQLSEPLHIRNFHNKEAILEAETFHDVIYDYKNPERKATILDKVANPNTKILVFDNMAANLANRTEKQVDVVTNEYKRLLRAFKGLKIVTSLYVPDDLKALCNHGPSLISLLLPENNMKTYVFDIIDLRKQHAPKELKALF